MSAECFGATGNADGRGYQAIDRFDISQSPADLNLYEVTGKIIMRASIVATSW